MGDLRRYRQKRDPDRTPEPFGDMGDAAPPRALPPGTGRRFVVQQHAARNLHWDLRLEIGEVLASWAIPKGPSLDPADKRLAVRTEDHPLEYADFEGVIPSGNYGAGAMIVWDCGTYRLVEDQTIQGRRVEDQTIKGRRVNHGKDTGPDAGSPQAGLEAGKLDLLLEGHKLRGRFALVRTRAGGGRDWLLLCKRADAHAAADVVEALPASVLSGLTVQEVGDGVQRDAELREALRALDAAEVRAAPRTLEPMLAATADAPFSREDWLFELKYDGVRVIAHRDGDDVLLLSRRRRDCTALYPEIAEAVRRLPVSSFAIDGEVVALDERGRSSFERLQRRFTQTDPDVAARLRRKLPVVFYAFDLPWLLGRDLRRTPLLERKRLLARVAPRIGVVRYADHVERDGLALFEAAREHELEGVIAKRASSRYETGKRSRAWLKVKVPRRTPVAIVGWVPGKGGRARLGSLMVAWHRGDELVYAGNVGSGLDESTIDALLPELEAAECGAPAFVGAPDPPVSGARYAHPRLVCDVGFTEVTKAGSLRHPVFLGLRDDLEPDACRAPDARVEAPPEPVTASAALPKPDAELTLTRLDKVFWPVEGYTKGDLLAYYEAAWPWLAPYLRDRPLVLTRYPDGIEGKSFFQKNAPDFTPQWATHRDIEGTDYFVCEDVRTLLYVINSGAIPLHVWSARTATLEAPDWLIIDLDPKEAPFAHVVQIARHLHRLLDEIGAAHFAKTSGQDGLHVMLPLGGALDHSEAKALGEVIARVVCAELPEIATITRPVAARGTRVYVDFLQNGRGKLIVAPLSVRPRAGAPVSMPLRWSQVTARLDPTRFTIRTALRELERRGDPFLPVLGAGVDVPALLEALAEHLARAEA